MSNEYFLINEGEKQGPYDIVALVIKIRNRTLVKDTLLARSDFLETKPASQWPELKIFFMELEAKKEDIASNPTPEKKRDLFACLKHGVNFLQHNMISTIFSGIFVLGIIAMVGMINILVQPNVRAFFYIVGFIITYSMFSCYMLMMLRIQRGQPLHMEYFKDKITQNLSKLVRVSLLISFPIIIGIVLLTSFENEISTAIMGLMIIIIPGIYIITVYSFAPLLILDQNYEVWDAMKTSRQYILKSGSENFSVYFALNAINFIAALIIVLPMVLTMPITMASVTEAYDELFS